MTILKFKWYKFYQKLFDERFRQNLKEILSDENKLREELKDKEDLIGFINSSKARKTLEKIIEMSDTQLSEYRRAGMIMPQKISEPAISREKLTELLRAGKIPEFNALSDRGGIEEIDLTRAYLSGAYLSGAYLNEAYLTEANLHRADLRGVYLHEADLSGADLSGADLSVADLSVADLTVADLTVADLTVADLTVADLIGADLIGADLYGAVLTEADLTGANLTGAYLRGAYLRGAVLTGADLTGADLTGADLYGAYLTGADLRGADLRGADLKSGIILIKDPNYHGAKVSDVNFENALINDRGFLEFLKENGAINVPDDVSTKDDFINAMNKKGLDIGGIEHFFDE